MVSQPGARGESYPSRSYYTNVRTAVDAAPLASGRAPLPPQHEARQTSPPLPFPYSLPAANTAVGVATASGGPPDLDQPAVVDDQTSLLDVDIDSLTDQPWRKPGAHLADYFNYSFDELTWKLYCARQKALRAERADEKQEIGRNPFKVFAELEVAEAWRSLPPELKGAMMTTIMSSLGPAGGMMPFAGMPGMPGMGMPGMVPPMMQPSGSGQQANNDDESTGNNWGDRAIKREDSAMDTGGTKGDGGYSAAFGNEDGYGDSSSGFRGRGRGATRGAFGSGGGKGSNPFGLNPGQPLVRRAFSHAHNLVLCTWLIHLVARTAQARSSGHADVASPPPDRIESPATRGLSPLPANIPTGPRKAGPPPTEPKKSRQTGHSSGRGGSYRDKDATGTTGADGLDYGDSASGAKRDRDQRGSDRDRGSSSKRRSRRRSYSVDSDDRYGRRRSLTRSPRSRSRSRSRSYSPPPYVLLPAQSRVY